MTNEQWAAIVHCDATQDGKFLYGVCTTGIFCRPSCKSRTPKRENVKIFSSSDEALSAGFHPCKRCRPRDERSADEELAERATALIHRHYPEVTTLAQLANRLFISPYHLHRVFKRLIGCTPTEYMRDTRLRNAERRLATTDQSIADIANMVGFPSPTYFATLFYRHYGMPPSSYRMQHGAISTVRGESHAGQ